MIRRDGVQQIPREGMPTLGRWIPQLWRLVAVASVLLALLLPASGGERADAADFPGRWSPPRTVYIPQTGQTIDGVFLDFWRANNGISNYGYPITPELTERGRTVQYYQYARFEYWPDDPDGNVVHLGAIGQELRPIVVLRTGAVLSQRGRGGDAASEAAKIARAWLPLDEKYAKKPNTDTWRYVPETRHSVQFGFKAWWEATGEASYLGNPLTEEYVLHGITYQVFERGQLAWKPGSDPWLVPLGEVLAKRYKLDTSPRPQGDIPAYDESLFNPPPSATGEKWIEVNLSTQYLIAWQGDTEVAETYVSTGRPGFDTPTGTFFINSKLESEDMAGVIGGEYYNVPDVPWVMYFTNVGHALHGTYWHNNFGTPMSHGCVNLPMDFAAWLYQWAPIGTRVEIHY
ncbi:MAG: hypothetical protein C4289_14235 [Chloroflexota bacterium]